MRKLVFKTLLFLILVNKVSAQTIKAEKAMGNLSGTITDAHHIPIEGVFITILDLKLAATTDSKGLFKLKNLPKGKYLVEARMMGYKSISQSISLQENTQWNAILEESYTESGEVIVTGVSKATLIRRNPVPIVAVSHDYLMSNLSTNAIDAIAKIPGVRTVTTGPNVSKPIIRGLGFNRILSLYDGVRQEGQQWGDEHGIEVDQYAVDKLEIIKGPASLSYGSDAIGGVVNIIPTQPAADGKTIGNITMDYQTNNKCWGGSAFFSSANKGVEWLLRVSHKMATNYQNKYDGRVFGTGFRETDATGSVGIHRKWGYSHINFVVYDNMQEVPDGSRDSATRQFTRQISEEDTLREIVPQQDLNSYSIERLHQHVQHYRAYWNNNFIIGNSNHLAVNVGYQNSIRREYNHPILFTIPGLYLQLQSFTYDIKYSFRERNNWDVSTGINGMYQLNKVTNGTEFIIPNYRQFDIGSFLTVKKTFGKLDIAGGARWDVRQFTNNALYTAINPATGFDKVVEGKDTVGATKVFSDYNKSFSGYSGSVGFAYNFSEKFSLKANIGRGYRAPNISEISANGVHPGTNIYQKGNQDFKPEFSLQEDIGLFYQEKYVAISVNLFNNVINNYIYNEKLTNPDGSELEIVPGNQTFQFQQAKAQLYGGEFSLDFHPIQHLHFENSISLVYGINKGVSGKTVNDSSKYLPFIPPTHGISELRFDFSAKHSCIAKGFIKVQAEYYAAQNRVYSAYNTETKTPGYALLNAGLGITFSNHSKQIANLYVMANNLFDKGYQDHLSRLKYFTSFPNPKTGVDGIYNMGRNISIKLDVPFVFK